MTASRLQCLIGSCWQRFGSATGLPWLTRRRREKGERKKVSRLPFTGDCLLVKQRCLLVCAFSLGRDWFVAVSWTALFWLPNSHSLAYLIWPHRDLLAIAVISVDTRCGRIHSAEPQKWVGSKIVCTAVVVVVVVVQRVEHHRRHRQHQHQFSSGRILCSSDCSHSFSWRQIFFASPVLFLLLLSKSQQAQLHFYMPAVVCVCPMLSIFPHSQA